MSPVLVAAVARIIGGADVRIYLGYDPTNPYEISLTFPDSPVRDGELNRWVCARSLAAATLARPGKTRGIGDLTMRLSPTGGTVLVTLTSLDGQAALLVPAARLRHLLARSEQMVPPGTEQVDVDGCIAALLDGVR